MADRRIRIELPAPVRDGDTSLERALQQRRSVRAFADRPIGLARAGQLLWAAQGRTDPRGRRTAPSAGALYPLEIYLVAGAVTNLDPGVYRYGGDRHRLEALATGDRREALGQAALGQSAVTGAPAVIVLGAVPARTQRKYGDRGERYVHMEAGHAAQNVLLQAVALELGAVAIGAFRDPAVRDVLGVEPPVEVLYLLPVGHPATGP